MENKVKAKKQYGQNFLKDKNVINKIVSSANIDSNMTVIEIGPGMGALTEELIKVAKKAICYEIDKDMVKILNDKFANVDKDKIEIIEQDFLKANLTDKFSEKDNVTVVANLPYYITTPILLKILEELNFVKSITIMVQKEVAERLAGKPNTKDYNALSVLVQYRHQAKILFDVSKKSFYPEPDVTSSVIQITRKENYLSALSDDYFYKFNRNIFKQRRKTLVNNIKESYSYDRKDIENILNDLSLDLKIRSESLSVEQIIKLSDAFMKL